VPSSLKVGKKGATYYISDKGKKVYADKVPTKEEGKGDGSGTHPSHAKKVASYKAKGQSTGESVDFDGTKHEVFVGGKGNHFYVSPKTGNKVILTKDKAKSMGLSDKAKKPTPKEKSKIDKYDESVKAGHQSKADYEAEKKSKQQVKQYEPSSTGHPKEKKYAGLETGDKSDSGQTVFKGKGGNYFTVHPDTGTKQIITKKSAKDQGFSGVGKSKKGALDTASKAKAAVKNFKPLPFGGNSHIIESEANKQWSTLSPDTQEHIKSYTGSAYKSINSGLRNPPPTGYAKTQADNMDRAFKQVSTPHDYTVFRGSSTNSVGRIPPVGGVYEDSGFSSTSFNRGTAGKFKNTAKKNKYVVEIDVPKGSKGIYVGSKSKHKPEKELLLDRGAKVRIVSKKLVNGVWQLKGVLEGSHHS
jgi:hypothetical protein